MDTTTMTNSEEITIFDEIVNCGILEDDSIVIFGAGHQDGKFLETLIDYNGTLGEGLITAVDPDKKRVKSLSKKFKGERINYVELSLQEYIDGENLNKDWSVITGIFDNNLYGEQQYDFVTSIIESSMSISNKGVIFSIKENISEEFNYSMLYFFVEFANSYDKFTIKKCGEDNYIFCIFKQ